MKNLLNIINEEKISKDNVVLWGVLEIPESGYDEEKIKKELEEKLFLIEKNIIITLISAWEKKYKDDVKSYENNLRKAATEASKYYKTYLKLTDPEDKEKWILDKIEKIKKDSNRNLEWASKFSNYPNDDSAHNKRLYFSKREGTKKQPIIWEPFKQNPTKLNSKDFKIYIYSDLTTKNSVQYLKWEQDISKLSKYIIDRFPTSPKDWKEHLKYIYIYTNNKSIYELNSIRINFGFDDEYEEKLSKSVKSFSDFMTKEYEAGKYMGD